MTFYEVLEMTGYPVAYGYFEENEAPELPYIVYMQDEYETIYLDDEAIYELPTYSVEYYFDRKSPENEKLLEQALKDHGYRYDRGSEEFISDEKMFCITYDVYSLNFNE